jgi:hypothetical protein
VSFFFFYIEGQPAFIIIVIIIVIIIIITIQGKGDGVPGLEFGSTLHPPSLFCAQVFLLHVRHTSW